MKTIKAFLILLFFVIIIGSIISFKANYNSNFCVRQAREATPGVFVCVDANSNPLTCPNLAENYTTNSLDGPAFCTTPVNAAGGCNPAPNCLTPTKCIKPN